jgi:hypothetical protein
VNYPKRKLSRWQEAGIEINGTGCAQNIFNNYRVLHWSLFGLSFSLQNAMVHFADNEAFVKKFFVVNAL